MLGLFHATIALQSVPPRHVHLPSRMPLQAAPRRVIVASAVDGERRPGYWENTTAFFGAFRLPKLDDDPLPAAVALNTHLKEVESSPAAMDFGRLSNLTMGYYRASFSRVLSNPAVADRLPDGVALLNGVILAVVLRLVLPRLLAIETMQDLYDFAPELGLPSREELLAYVDYAGQMSFATKLGLFLLVITLEKVTLLGEVLPIGVLLPAISPLLFGGVLEGTVISAACASAGSSVNFMIARTFFRERFLKLRLWQQPPVGETAWFGALARSIEKDGFKAALLLRLAPVLPIPIDAHWYVVGLTPLRLWEFSSAYFLGALKVTFLDAYLGSTLTSAALGTDDLSAGGKSALLLETVGIVVVSLLVSQFATQLFSDMMAEEGFTPTVAGVPTRGQSEGKAEEASRSRPEARIAISGEAEPVVPSERTGR